MGTVGVVGFGLEANSIHDDYVATPTSTTRDRGLVMKGLTNGSIAVLSLGAALVVADLVFAKTGAHRRVSSSSEGVAVTF
jgi:hypothetical protein